MLFVATSPGEARDVAVRTISAKRVALPVLSVSVIVVAFAIIPAVGSDYWFNAILIPFLIMAVAGLGLNLTMGYAGQASLGSGAFMAVGAYATYNLLLRLPWLPLPASLILGGLISGLTGLLVGLPSLRIKGFYLIATTLAAQFLIEWTLNQYGWFSNYASSSSISAPHLAFLGLDLSSPLRRYLLALISALVVTLVAIQLVRSTTGRAWMAIRDMDTAAAVIGIPVARFKLQAFFVGAFICGIAGALWAFAYLGTVDARSFDLDRSFQVLFIIIIIGGMGSIAGSYVGAGFIVLLPILMDRFASMLLGTSVDGGQLQNLQHVLFGALIIWLLIREPLGLVALFRRLFARSRKPRASSSPLDPETYP